MNVSVERQDGVVSACVSGRIDSTTAPALQEAINDAIGDDDRALIVDLEKLAYISSAGLRVMLLTAKNMRSRNVGFALCSLSDMVQEVFEISGFDKIVTIHATRAAARASIDD